jgi:hypothetical protein
MEEWGYSSTILALGTKLEEKDQVHAPTAIPPPVKKPQV